MQRQNVDLAAIRQEIIKYQIYLEAKIIGKKSVTRLNIDTVASEVLEAELKKPGVHLAKYDGLNKLLKKYAIILEWLAAIDSHHDYETRLFELSQAFYKPQYHALLKLKRHALDRTQSTGSKLVDRLKTKIPNLSQPALVSATPIPATSIQRGEALKSPTPEAKKHTAPSVTASTSVTEEQVPPPIVKEKSLFEKLIEHPGQHDEDFGDAKRATTTSNHILTELSADQVAKLTGSLRRKLLTHTDSADLVAKHVIVDDKIVQAEGLQENRAALVELVASKHFDTLNLNDDNTRQTLQLALKDISEPSVLRVLRKKCPEFTASINARLVSNPPFALQLLNSNEVTPDDLAQLSTQTLESLTDIFGDLSDDALEKLASLAKFTDVFTQSPATMARLVSLGKPQFGAALLSGTHFAWSKQNLSSQQVNILAQADEKNRAIIYPQLALAARLTIPLHKQQALQALIDDHYQALTQAELSEPQRAFKEKLKDAIQEIYLANEAEYKLYAPLIENLFLNDALRDVFLSNIQPGFIVKRLLPNAECFAKFFTVAERKKPGVIQTQFPRVIPMLPLEASYIKQIILTGEVSRSFTEDEITTLLSFNDEVITNYLLKHKDKFITARHRKNAALIYGNAPFVASFISEEVIPALKFIDLLMDDAHAEFCKVFLLQNNIRDYLSKVRAVAINHVAEATVLKKLSAFSSSRKQLIVSPPATQAPLKPLETVRASLAAFRTGFDNLTASGVKAKSIEERIDCYTKAFLLPDSSKNIKWDETKGWKNTSKTVINGEATTARIVLGKRIIDAALREKLWDYLAIVLNEKTEIKTGGLGVFGGGNVIPYQLTLQAYFGKKFYELSFEGLIELLHAPRFADIQWVLAEKEANEKIAAQLIALGVGKTQQLDNCTLIHLRLYPHYLKVFEARLKQEDLFQLIDDILGKTANNCEMISDEKGKVVLDALISLAHQALKMGKDKLPATVRQIIADALKQNQLTFEELVSKPEHCKLFAGCGTQLIPHIKTPQQAALVFHYFPQFKMVFSGEQLLSLWKKAEEIPAPLQLTGIFKVEPLSSLIKEITPPPVPTRAQVASAGPGSQASEDEKYHDAPLDDFLIDPATGTVSFGKKETSATPPGKPQPLHASAEPAPGGQVQPPKLISTPKPPPPPPKKPATGDKGQMPSLTTAPSSASPKGDLLAALQGDRPHLKKAPAQIPQVDTSSQQAKNTIQDDLRKFDRSQLRSIKNNQNPAAPPAPAASTPKLHRKFAGSTSDERKTTYPKLPDSLAGFRLYVWIAICKLAKTNDADFVKRLEEAMLAFGSTKEILSNDTNEQYNLTVDDYKKTKANFEKASELAGFKQVCNVLGISDRQQDDAVKLYCDLRDAFIELTKKRQPTLSRSGMFSSGTSKFIVSAELNKLILGLIEQKAIPEVITEKLEDLSKTQTIDEYEKILNEVKKALEQNAGVNYRISKKFKKAQDIETKDALELTLEKIQATWKKPASLTNKPL